MKIAVIGGGPAGMAAAISAAKQGASVTLYEKNEKLGKKLYISGKGRCNVTNECSPLDYLKNVVSNPKFMYGPIFKFSPYDTIAFFESNGLKLKTERGNRVFPETDKSSDVIKTFVKVLAQLNVKIELNAEILSVEYQKNSFLLTTITDIVSFDKVIIATGGQSYSATGSTGDGYKFAEFFGHNVVALRAALCKIRCDGVLQLEGLSLKNVDVAIVNKKGKRIDGEFGEMVFTADGISGPAVLSLSSRVNRKDLAGCTVSIDLKPALNDEKLDARILRDFSQNLNKDFINSLGTLLPERLIKETAIQSGIPFSKKVNQISAAERSKLVYAVKNLRFSCRGLDEIEAGIVTAGGVDVREINPSTMESKKQAGLFFCGEVIDVDCYTGGFNIQTALSTGFVAGNCAAQS